MRSLWLLIALLPGCIQDNLVTCNGVLCPVGSLCAPNNAGGCVLQGQLDVCHDQPDHMTCQVLDLPAGYCLDGVCQIATCGNGITEAPIEQCDDGNHFSGDGCSADCASIETCGNGVIDAVTGEQCDSGIPGLSGDGCTSGCLAEFDLWQDITPSQLGGRSYFRMVYDEAHHQIVGFGGTTGAEPLAETWIYDHGHWQQRFPPSSPEPRYGHAMAYDKNRGVVVLFGGYDGIALHQSVWEWDGAAWTKRTLSPQPGGRINAALGWDPSSQTLVLYGGNADDMWTYDGTTWARQLLPATPGTFLGVVPVFAQMWTDPIDQQLYVMCARPGANVPEIFDWNPANGWDDIGPGPTGSGFQDSTIVSLPSDRAIWFGGREPTTSTYMNATYRWNGGAWTLLATANSPPIRFRAGGAVDENGDPLIFGGTDGVTQLRDTYSWKTNKWGALPTTPIPTARWGTASAFDSGAGEVALFGGFTTVALGETWAWNEPSWAPGLGSNTPQARMHSAMAFDNDADSMVLFGGESDPCNVGSGGGSGSGSSGTCTGSNPPPTTVFSDTWVLRHRTWSKPVVTSPPPARASAAMAYDAGHADVVMFGGNALNLRLADTWLWNGATWTQLSPPTSPPAMTGARMVYDHASRVIVMYGGTGATGSVWLFDGTTWTDATPALGPAPRAGAVFIYDPRRQRAVLFGGVLASGQLVDDTWEWNTATRSWSQRTPVQTPPLRSDATAVYDAVSGHVMMFGGRGVANRLLSDVWTYGFVSSSEPAEVCIGHSDADHDGLAGCADPDCWARCTPTCPPGTTCDDTKPHCGDGTCTTIETHALCPADCF